MLADDSDASDQRRDRPTVRESGRHAGNEGRLGVSRFAPTNALPAPLRSSPFLWPRPSATGRSSPASQESARPSATRFTSWSPPGRFRPTSGRRQRFPRAPWTCWPSPALAPRPPCSIGTELGISTVEGVEQAAMDGRLASLPRMGRKAADGILRHIRASRSMSSDRTPIGAALPAAESVMAALREHDPGISLLTPARQPAAVGGDHRRR